LSPVVLFTYNRLWHTQQTVESLVKNDYASESELFVFSDGGRDGEDWEKIQKVREYLKTISGFKKVEIFESEYNKGLANSIIDGVTKIVELDGKIIVLEDDLVTSKYFLRYMNDALEIYKNDEDVACITGYVYPIKNFPQTFFIKGADCWGWGTWKNAWDIFEQSGEKLLNEIQSKKLETEFDFNGNYPYVQMLKDQINGKNNSWAIRWYASAFLKDKLCLYPGESFVQNIGHDCSGVHCAETNLFDVQMSSSCEKIEKIPTFENKNCRKLFENFFGKL
jgi:hypothetical protein